MLHIFSSYYADIFLLIKSFSLLAIEDDKPEHDSVTQSGQQNLSGAAVGSSGVIQQGEQSMSYTILCAYYTSNLVYSKDSFEPNIYL